MFNCTKWVKSDLSMPLETAELHKQNFPGTYRYTLLKGFPQSVKHHSDDFSLNLCHYSTSTSINYDYKGPHQCGSVGCSVNP